MTKLKITWLASPGEGMWTVIDGEPSKRGGVYKWTEPGVEPCLEHRVRIWVHGEVAGISFLDHATKLKFRVQSRQCSSFQQ